MIKTDISQELLDILTPYSDWFFKQDLSPLNKLAKDNPKYPEEGDFTYLRNINGQHIIKAMSFEFSDIIKDSEIEIQNKFILSKPEQIKIKTKFVISKLSSLPIMSVGFVNILDKFSGSCFR